MILLALDKLGGADYLVALGRENSSAYASLLSKVLPSTLAAESDGGVGVQLVLRHALDLDVTIGVDDLSTAKAAGA
jgi:hypothetical protein